MDAQDQVQNVPLKEESDVTNPQTQLEESLQNPKQDKDVSTEGDTSNTSPKDADSSKDASEADPNITSSQPGREDLATPDDPSQGTTFPNNQVLEEKDISPDDKPDSSQGAGDAEAGVADSPLEQDEGVESPPTSMEDATLPADQTTADSEVALPNDTDSSQEVTDVDANKKDSQLKPEENTTSSDDPIQHKAVPIEESTNENMPSKDIDSLQDSAEIIDEVPQSENADPFVPDKQNEPIADDELSSNNVSSQIISPIDEPDNTKAENNDVMPLAETNGSTAAHDKENDNAVVTINDDSPPSKTNGIEQAPSSKEDNYCAENWLLVFAICLIILTVIGGIILAVLIVPILSKQIIRPMRLPENVIPEHYVLEIQPTLLKDKPEFDGSVVITIICVNSTNKLILHSLDLEIDEDSTAVINLDGGDSPFVLKTQRDLENEFIIFFLCKNLTEGTKYDVHIVFKGRFSKGDGFAMTEYERNGITKLTASTKFESIFARTAFPCFDEPALKATFDINIHRWKNMSSLSNMKRLTTIEKDEDWEIDMYQRTVRMSTYLVAFVIGEMEGIERGRVSIWAEKDIEFYQYALNVTEPLLKFYESYLGVPYSLPKLDQFVAEQYPSGGMEHWGLIVYKSEYLKSGQSDEKYIARLVSHELAHQWFGNLVTMKWWDDIWLNEGFAAYFGYIGANIIDQEWKMEEQLVRYIDNYFNLECGSRWRIDSPMHKHVDSTLDVKGYLRDVIYRKGAALVTMMHMLLGDAVFRKGLKSYLEENAFGSVVQDDLWRHLTMAQPLGNRIDMKNLMESWTKHSYHPLITVTRKYADHEAIVEQTSCINPFGKESKDLWTVPITLIDGTRPNYKNMTVMLMLNTEKAILPNLPGKETWILVNIEQVGYFRVNYDANNWELLLWQLRHNFQVIPTVSRKQLISDSLYFANINKLSHAVALDIITYYPFEKEELVLGAVFADRSTFFYYRSMVKYTDAEIYWKKFIEYLFKPVFIRHAKIWEGEGITDYSRFKWLSAGELCYEGYQPCLTVARIKFREMLEGRSLQKPTFEMAFVFGDIFCALARYSSEEEWNNMNKAFKNESLVYFYSFLACTEIDELFQRLISEFFSKTKKIPGLKMLLSEKRWRFITEFLEIHWKETAKHKEILSIMATQLHNKATFDIVNEFYQLHKNELNNKENKGIERMFSDGRHRIPSPDAIKTVKTWLKSKSWENIDISDIQ